MDKPEDYWPDDLVDKIPDAPQDILRPIAAALGPKTNNVVIAEVHSHTDSDGDFVHAFVLRVPALQNYRYVLFQVWHKIEVFPIHVSGKEIHTEEEFREFIKQQIAAPETVKIIRSLVSQARNLDPPDEIPF